jgi:hypothetical protein
LCHDCLSSNYKYSVRRVKYPILHQFLEKQQDQLTISKASSYLYICYSPQLFWHANEVLHFWGARNCVEAISKSHATHWWPFKTQALCTSRVCRACCQWEEFDWFAWWTPSIDWQTTNVGPAHRVFHLYILMYLH